MRRAAVGAMLSVVAAGCDGLELGGSPAAAGETHETDGVATMTSDGLRVPYRGQHGRFLDVNGDGFADAAIGAPSAQSTFVYHGSASGLGASAAATLVGAEEAGAAVGVAGDVNGDGFGDLIVGSGVGSATVYLGAAAGINPNGIALDPGESLRFGAGVSTAGDVNGDRFDDVIVGTRYGAFVYLGNAGGINTQPTYLLTGPGSAALTVVGGTDFNRDGFGDVVVGSGNIGVNIFMGGRNGLATTPSLTLAGAGGAAAAGDVNGDRYSDLLVATGSGTVAVHAGSRRGLGATPIATLSGAGGAAIGDAGGGTLSSAGDLNGDGFDDVIVGTIYDDHAYVFLGARRGPAPAPAMTLAGAPGTGFGAAVAGAGDTNGDGFGDVIIGARTTGQAFLHLGGAGGLSATPALTLTGPPRFGEAVAKTSR